MTTKSPCLGVSPSPLVISKYFTPLGVSRTLEADTCIIVRARLVFYVSVSAHASHHVRDSRRSRTFLTAVVSAYAGSAMGPANDDTPAASASRPSACPMALRRATPLSFSCGCGRVVCVCVRMQGCQLRQLPPLATRNASIHCRGHMKTLPHQNQPD